MRDGEGDSVVDRVVDIVREGATETDDDSVIDDDEEPDGVTVGDGFTHNELPGLDT